MSNQPSQQGTSASRKFIPEVKSLEPRCLLSGTIPRSDVIVLRRNPSQAGGLAIQSGLAITDLKISPPSVPRTGGLAIQSGSVLSCFVGNPKGNTVHVTDITKGTVEMSWNFGQPQSFTGVATTVIHAERARTNQFTFNLTHGDTVTAVAAAAGSTFDQPVPSTASTAIELSPHGPADTVRAKAGHPLAHHHNEPGGLTIQTDKELTLAANGAQAAGCNGKHFVPFVNDGRAVQTGSELTVTVNRPTTNVVEITDKDKLGVLVEWNGGMVHSFTGVATIVVNTRNARKDQVTLEDPFTAMAALAGNLVSENNGSGKAQGA
jgi:hypothetical protein